MKRIIILSFFLFSFPFFSNAQVEIAPFAGYMFGGSVNFIQGSLKLRDNANYGVSLIVPKIKFGTDLEINYTRMDGSAYFRSYSPDYNDRDFTLSTNYFQIGVLKSLTNDDKVQPFGSFSLGATLYSPKEPDLYDTWRFSITAGLGAKVFFTDKVGLILRGRIMMPMYFNGVGGWCGISTGGSGCGLGLSSTAVALQGDLTAGLIFRLGN